MTMRGGAGAGAGGTITISQLIHKNWNCGSYSPPLLINIIRRSSSLSSSLPPAPAAAAISSKLNHNKQQLILFQRHNSSSKFVIVTAAASPSSPETNTPTETSSISSSGSSSSRSNEKGEEEDEKGEEEEEEEKYEEYEVEIEQPYGLKFAKGRDGATYIDAIAPGFSADRTGKFTVGDKVIATSAVFGTEIWPAAEYGRTMYTIRQRIGPLYMKMQKRFGNLDYGGGDLTEKEIIRAERNSGVISNRVREIQLLNYQRKIEQKQRRESELRQGLQLYKNGQYEEAREKFESVLGSNPTPDEASVASYNVACCYSKLDQIQAGLSALEDALEAGYEDFKVCPTATEGQQVEYLAHSSVITELSHKSRSNIQRQKTKVWPTKRTEVANEPTKAEIFPRFATNGYYATTTTTTTTTSRTPPRARVWGGLNICSLTPRKRGCFRTTQNGKNAKHKNSISKSSAAERNKFLAYSPKSHISSDRIRFAKEAIYICEHMHNHRETTNKVLIHRFQDFASE